MSNIKKDYKLKAKDTLIKLLKSDDEKIVLKACNEILNIKEHSQTSSHLDKWFLDEVSKS